MAFLSHIDTSPATATVVCSSGRIFSWSWKGRCKPWLTGFWNCIHTTQTTWSARKWKASLTVRDLILERASLPNMTIFALTSWPISGLNLKCWSNWSLRLLLWHFYWVVSLATSILFSISVFDVMRFSIAADPYLLTFSPCFWIFQSDAALGVLDDKSF